MRKIIAFYDVGMIGCDGIEALIVGEDLTYAEIDVIVNEGANEHAISWDESENEDEYEDFMADVGGWWEDYDPEKHDMKRPGGGSFADDFDFQISRGW